MLTKTITVRDGEINVYRDEDGYHAERWSESRQAIVAQSGDRPTEVEATLAVSDDDADE